MPICLQFSHCFCHQSVQSLFKILHDCSACVSCETNLINPLISTDRSVDLVHLFRNTLSVYYPFSLFSLMVTLVSYRSFSSLSTCIVSALFVFFHRLLFRFAFLACQLFSFSHRQTLVDDLSAEFGLHFLSSMGTSALACPDESFPSATNPLISAGSFRSRRELVIYGLLLLTLLDTSSCVKPYVLIICSRPSASSIGFRSSRCIFSMIAISIFSSSENSRIRQGTSFSSAPLAALHLSLRLQSHSRSFSF